MQQKQPKTATARPRKVRRPGLDGRRLTNSSSIYWFPPTGSNEDPPTPAVSLNCTRALWSGRGCRVRAGRKGTFPNRRAGTERIRGKEHNLHNRSRNVFEQREVQYGRRKLWRGKTQCLQKVFYLRIDDAAIG